MPLPECKVTLLSGESANFGPFNNSLQLSFSQGNFSGNFPGSDMRFDRNSALVIDTTICETWEQAVRKTKWSKEKDLLEMTLIKSECGAKLPHACTSRAELVGILNPYYQAVHPEYADMIRVYIEGDLLEGNNQFYWYPREYVPEKYICEKKYILGIEQNSYDCCILR